MDKYLQEIEHAVKKAGIEGALTEEAVTQFHGVIEKCDELTGDLETSEKARASLILQRDQLQADLGIAQALNKVAAEAEMAMIEREAKITKLECKAEHMEERVKDHKEMFTTVFRNSVLRKEVMTPLPGLKQDQYGTSHAPYAQKDSVEEKEE